MHPMEMNIKGRTAAGYERAVRSPAERHGGALLEDLAADEAENGKPLSAGGIYCSQCLKLITTPDQRIEVQGGHQHTFANPHGIVFEIGCFSAADGCMATGRPTRDFSWFDAFSWQAAICRRCLVQVGWLFSSAAASGFYALILNRLFFPLGGR